jgi:hypothetical protein
VWIGSIILGIVVCRHSCGVLASLMYESVFTGMSIFGSVLVTALPLLISALVLDRLGGWLLLPLCFLSGFFQGFFGFASLISFGNSAWLVRPLLFFSSLFTLPLLWLFWIHYIRRGSLRCFPFFLLAAVAVRWIDISFIAPFLTGILSL